MVAVLTGFVRTAPQFYWIRFLLGAAEAGIFPGIVVYLSHWFRYEDRAKALAFVCGGAANLQCDRRAHFRVIAGHKLVGPARLEVAVHPGGRSGGDSRSGYARISNGSDSGFLTGNSSCRLNWHYQFDWQSGGICRPLYRRLLESSRGFLFGRRNLSFSVRRDSGRPCGVAAF